MSLPMGIQIELSKLATVDGSTIDEQLISATNMYIALRSFPLKERDPIIAKLKKQFEAITE